MAGTTCLASHLCPRNNHWAYDCSMGQSEMISLTLSKAGKINISQNVLCVRHCAKCSACVFLLKHHNNLMSDVLIMVVSIRGANWTAKRHRNVPKHRSYKNLERRDSSGVERLVKAYYSRGNHARPWRTWATGAREVSKAAACGQSGTQDNQNSSHSLPLEVLKLSPQHQPKSNSLPFKWGKAILDSIYSHNIISR